MKNPVCDATGWQASLTLFEHGIGNAMLFALITVATPAKATWDSFRPAAPRPIQHRRAYGALTFPRSLGRRVGAYSPSSQPFIC